MCYTLCMNTQLIIDALHYFKLSELIPDLLYQLYENAYIRINDAMKTLHDRDVISSGGFFATKHSASDVKVAWNQFSIEHYPKWHLITEEDYRNTHHLSFDYAQLCKTLTPENIESILYTRIFETEHYTDITSYPYDLQVKTVYNIMLEYGKTQLIV